MRIVNDTAKSFFRRLSGAALLGGLIVTVFGLYNLVVRAGVPYQDPTAEMQLQYAIIQGAGRALLRTGVTLIACGAAIRLAIGLFSGKRQ